MIIGISGSQFGKTEIAEFLNKKYSFEYLDVDKMVAEILNDESFKTELNENEIANDELLLLNIKNEIDRRLLIKINNLPSNKTLVISYSLLEDSIAFEKCNLIIRNYSNSNITTDATIEVLKNIEQIV